MSEALTFTSRSELTGSRVDREAGIIRGVSIAHIGEAKGHDQYVDLRTLEQVRECVKAFDSGLKVKFNPESFNHGDAGIAGYIPGESLRIKGKKLVGDLHVYKNYPRREYLFEMAEESPDHFGLSMEFSGVPEEKGDKNFARCTEIYGASVVDLPAANPTGLFSEKRSTGVIVVADWINDKVEYADPGYQDDGEQRCMIDNAEHVRESWSYVTDEENTFEYKADEISKIKTRIKKAAKKFGIELSTKEDDKTMDKETIKALALAFSEAIKPVLDEFRVKLSDGCDPNGDECDPSKEELAAAGVAEGDDKKTKAKKMKAYRATADEPLTRRDLMQFFARTGGKPAGVSGAGEGAHDKSEKVDAFETLIEKEIEKGAKNRGRAIMLARKRDGKAYTTWMRKRQNPKQEEE